MGKELSLQLEGLLALAGALTAYIICFLPAALQERPNRTNPTGKPVEQLVG